MPIALSVVDATAATSIRLEVAGFFLSNQVKMEENATAPSQKVPTTRV